MDDQPYTTPDEDPFNVQPVLRQPRRRRSSLLDKWIIEQQTQPSINKPPIANLPSAVTSTHPYLAYPELNSRIYLTPNNGEDDEITLNSYDIVDDEDIPQDRVPEIEIPSTPTSKRNRIPSVNSITPSSFRHFSVSFRAPSTPSKTEDVSHQNFSRLSLFSRGSRQSFGGTPKNTLINHNRSASESVRSSPALHFSKVSSPSPPKWRPSVLGHFSQSAISVPSDTLSTPSRPSISSADTNYTASSLTGPSSDCGALSSASRPSLLESVRPYERSPQGSFMSTLDKSFNSTWSQNFSQSSPSIRAYEEDSRVLNTTSTLPSRLPFAPKARSCLSNVQEMEPSDPPPQDQPKKRDSLRPSVAYSSKRSRSRIHLPSLSSRNQKKKKLVVSGVQPEDTPKFEGVKRWCENFGEVRQIVRMPNGDLHVDFSLAEVADTVCRLRAKVYINGVGSVHLSWYYNDRR